MSSRATRGVPHPPIEEKRALLARRLREQALPPGRCLHRRFEAHAARTPDAPALSFEGRTWSYGELNERANRLAHRLRRLGVGPEVLVGMFLDRSVELVVGVLGILKAGGAYVPMDPVYPRERLSWMLEDARVAAVLTQESLRDRLPAHPPSGPIPILPLDADDCPGESAENPHAGVAPANLAYVIYTSGSTGRPKGVPVTHANVGRLLDATRHWFHFDRDDVWTLFHSYAFDFSVWELWGALACGGRLVVVPYLVSRSPEAFLDLLRDERATVLNQTPSAFRQLIRADESRGGADELALRLVIFGGEALELQGLKPWFDRRGDRAPQLVNMYGITETTVHVTYRPVSAADLAAMPGSSPIGRPIPDLRLHVLDRHMQPVPVGVVGELYVGGAGLARGYLNRPALTAERFVPDPFGAEPGARLYRSGDLARRRPDGDVEYLGRADDQVKIRGHRVELGEIEAALVRHPAVREAVVLAREDTVGDTRLAAYVVAAPGRSAPPAAELRDRLKEELPPYMVPSAFVALEALPLTPNGKVDRKALPAPDGARPAEARAFVPPRTPVEELIAGAWASVLGVERVGIHDDFFDLGGHSLLATQVVSRLRAALGREVPLRGLFEAPTVAGLARLVEADRRGGLPAAPIRPVPRDGAPPPSFSQQSLWFLDRLDPGRPTFNVAAAVRVAGPLDVPALRRALNEIVRRHEALRTTFAPADGTPAQVIAPSLTLPLDVTDLRGVPDPARESERLAIAEARRPFDLARGPLVRAGLLRLADDEHALLLTMHHIVTDGWSLGVAAQELATLYDAFTRGEPSPLPDPPIQYADYAAWQRDRLSGAALDDLLSYWTRQLAGVPPLELPTDRPRPAARSSRGAIRFFALPPALTEGLNALGRREGATPFMTLLAAFQALLHRYVGQEDFAVGSPVANRNRAETEGLVGYFVNMLALRADLSGDPTFRDLLARVRETALGAFEHQDLPLESVVEALALPRDPSRTPLFQAMFVLQNNRMPHVGRQELVLSPLVVGEGSGTAKFDLTLALGEAGGGMVGSFEYSTDLFDPATIDRMVGHFLALLDGIVSDPARRVSELPLLADGERRHLIDDLNRTAADFPRDSCVHGLIAAQVARTPDALALAWEGGELTYRELDTRANQLAHHLLRRGVGPDVRVGIAVGRSPEMAVGLLGILKAGGAYVPLDPSYPRERLALMLRDAGIGLLLTQHHLLPALPEHGAEVVCLDSHWDRIAREPTEPPESGAGPGDAAYVIYTSGSTGTPRGVVVSHRSLVNHNVAAARLFGLRPEDRVLQFSSLSFDIAVEELFPAWIRGAAVVLRGDDATLEPARFTDRIDRERITVLDLPTAYWHAWVDALATLGATLPGSLRLVVVGGEKAQPAAHARWRAIAGDRVRWLNTYGPTEATVIATAYEPPADRDAGPELPIGRPIANARIYLLDPRLEPVPLGLPGELYIGGEGVARGYLGRPGLTAETFLPDPFAPLPGGRMFRTGDRARWRPDGNLEFLGRTDHQVKIRGFRVEPGEVEAALLAHPAVRAAAVLARADAGGVGRLDAFVVGPADGTIPPDDLRRFLGERLPRHMVPSTFTTLAALPLTPSGKVDRRALPQPDRSEVGREVVAPRDEVEAGLAQVWEELLDVRPIGVADNFFDLGGHSLLAIRLLSRIEARFGRALPLSALFVGGTIEELAPLLRAPDPAASWSPLVPIQPAGAGRPFFCVHPAGGIVYCFRELARRLGTDRPFYGLQAAGLDGEREPYACLEEMAARYVEAVRETRPDGPYHLGGWSLGGLVAFEMARQLRASGHEVATLALFDTQAPAPDAARDPAVLALARRLPELGAGVEILGRLESDEDAAFVAEVALELAEGFGGDVARLFAHLRGLPADEQRALVFQYFGIDRVYHLEAGPERTARLWAVLRANVLAGARHRPAPFDGPVTLYRAAARRFPRGSDPTMGWGRLASGGVRIHDIPGDHATLLGPPGVEVLARLLRTELEGREAGTR